MISAVFQVMWWLQIREKKPHPHHCFLRGMGSAQRVTDPRRGSFTFQSHTGIEQEAPTSPCTCWPHPLFLRKAGTKTRRQKQIEQKNSPTTKPSPLRIPRKHVPYKYMSSVINSRVPFRVRSNCLALLGTTDTSKPRALCSATWSSAWGYLFSFFK